MVSSFKLKEVSPWNILKESDLVKSGSHTCCHKLALCGLMILNEALAYGLAPHEQPAILSSSLDPALQPLLVIGA